MSPCLLRFNLLMSPCLLRTSESIDVHKVTRTKIKIVCDKPKTQIRTTHTQEKSCGARVAHAALRYTFSRPVTEDSDLSRTAAFVRLRDLTRLMIPTVNPVRFHRGQRPGLFASLSTGYGPARVQANAVSLDHVARVIRVILEGGGLLPTERRHTRTLEIGARDAGDRRARPASDRIRIREP
jgi:hypothetical protein